MPRPWLPLAAFAVLAASGAWTWLSTSAGETGSRPRLPAGGVPAPERPALPDAPPRATDAGVEGFVAAPGERLELPPPDPRAALAWVPERLPAEELVLGGGDEPVVWLEEDFTDCEGPPLVRLLAVHADGLVVETAHRGTAETEPAFRRERRIDPVRLGPLLAALNEAGFFAIRLDPREQVRKESLSPSGSRPDDGPEFRTSRLSVRLSGGTYSAAGTNLADHVRRMPDFVELAALERSLARVGEALAADPAR